MAIRNGILLVSALCLAGIGQVAQSQTEVPNEFQAGQPARASEVNENFDILEQAVQDLELSSSTIPIQVQSAIDVASEPRWVVQDFYSRFGRWPIDNAEAGAELAQFYVNSVVTRIDISGNVVTATFGNNAPPELDGETITFTFIDNAGSIYFLCQTTVTIESMLPVDYCNYVDSPPTRLQTIRTQVSSAVALASEARWHVEDHYRNRGAFPNDNAEAGAWPAPSIANDVVSNVSITAGGQVTATFSLNANANIAADSITFVPTDNGGSISWSCNTAGLYQRYVPQLLGGNSCVEVPDPEPATIALLRRQIVSAFPAAERLQMAAEAYYSANGVWPASNAEAGEPGPASFAGNVFVSIGVSSNRSGTIVVTYGASAHPALDANTLEFMPTDFGGNIDWRCQTPSIAQRYLPYECRN